MMQLSPITGPVAAESFVNQAYVIIMLLLDDGFFAKEQHIIVVFMFSRLVCMKTMA